MYDMSGSYLSIKQLTDSFENKVVKKRKEKKVVHSYPRKILYT